MRLAAFAALAAATLIFPQAICAAENEATVPAYHADAARSGHYVVPGLTWANAGDMRRDEAFDGRVPGHIYAQPLYWHPSGAASGLVIVATEDNSVVALDPGTGRTESRPGDAPLCIAVREHRPARRYRNACHRRARRRALPQRHD
jgi:hypothetical protein